MKKIFKIGCTIVLLMVMLVERLSVEAYAFSDSAKAKLPNTTYYVQSNVWQSTTHWRATHSYKVSAKLYRGKALDEIATASTIKTTWSGSATGVAISISGTYGVATGGGSISTTGNKGFSGSWENTNTWISDISGTFKISGLPLYGTLSNTAFAVKDGVKATATAECFRVY